MELKIEFAGRDDVQASDRGSISVETHTKRGDVYTVEKVDQVLENDTVTFKVRGGSRLVITVPDGDNEVVYDSAQGAAIRKGAMDVDGTQARALSEAETTKNADPKPTGTTTMTPQQKAAADAAERAKTHAEATKKAEDEKRAKAAAEQAKAQGGNQP